MRISDSIKKFPSNEEIKNIVNNEIGNNVDIKIDQKLGDKLDQKADKIEVPSKIEDLQGHEDLVRLRKLEELKLQVENMLEFK